MDKWEQYMLPMDYSQTWCEWCGDNFFKRHKYHRFCCEACEAEFRMDVFLAKPDAPKELKPMPKELKYEDKE